MKVRVTMGGELDIVTPQEMNDAIDGLGRKLTPERVSRRVTYQKKTFSVITIANNSSYLLPLESPPPGKIWLLQHVSVFILSGGAPFTDARDGVMLYVGNIDGRLVDPNTNTLLPSAAQNIYTFFDKNRAWTPDNPYPIFPNETLFGWITFTGGVAGNVITMNALYVEIDDTNLLRPSA